MACSLNIVHMLNVHDIMTSRHWSICGQLWDIIVDRFYIISISQTFEICLFRMVSRVLSTEWNRHGKVLFFSSKQTIKRTFTFISSHCMCISSFPQSCMCAVSVVKNNQIRTMNEHVQWWNNRTQCTVQSKGSVKNAHTHNPKHQNVYCKSCCTVHFVTDLLWQQRQHQQ